MRLFPADTAFLPSPLPTPTRRPRTSASSTTTCPSRICMASTSPKPSSSSSSASFSTPPPTAARVLRLERALAAAVEQERYTDAATLRDALAAARTSDPLLSKRAELAAAVAAEDFNSAARLRDELATLTERCAKGEHARHVDRIVILRGRADPEQTLRVATVSPDGDLALPLLPTSTSTSSSGSPAAMLGDVSLGGGGSSGVPRVFLQPTWSPTGDYVAMTEIAFHIDASRVARGVAVAETESRLVVMNALDGSVVRSVSLKKPPFFYFWSPDGQCVTLLSNDPTSSVTTVAMSALQVVAGRGGAGLDTQTVTGPLVSGHPLLYDFCPRDSPRIVVHMGDCDTVAVLRMSTVDRGRRVLTSQAGTFGTPQWHPLGGKDGREVVLFVEAEEVDAETKEEMAADSANEGNKDESEADGTFEKFMSNGTSLLESVLRKGAESLGWVGSNGDDNDSKLNMASKLQQLEDKLRKLMSPNKNSSNSNTGDENAIIVKIIASNESLDGDININQNDLNEGEWEVTLDASDLEIDDQDDEDDDDDDDDDEFDNEGDTDGSGNVASTPKMQRLVMCDVDRPELRRTLARFSGVMAFKLSPDGRTMATLVTNPLSGDDELTVCTADFSPDSVIREDDPQFRFGNSSSLQHQQQAADIMLSTPSTRVVAFFWSPNSRKLLFLSSLRHSTVGAAQWATFDLQTSKVVRYEKFIMSGIYVHCLNFFDQFAMSMTPWSPDSKRFCYPGRPLTKKELERDDAATDMSAGNSPALSALFVQKDAAAAVEQKKFVARVQKVPDTSGSKGSKVKPEAATTIVDNVEYACWSPC